MNAQIAMALLAALYGGALLRRRLRGRGGWRGVSAATRRVIAAASTMVTGQKRSGVTAADIIYVALFDVEVATSITLPRHRLEQLRSALFEHLSALPSEPAAPLELDPSVLALFARASDRAKDHRRTAVTPSDLVAVAAKIDALPSGLLEPFDLRPSSAHTPDAPPIDYRGTATDLQQVVIWDDDKTTMEHVVEVVKTFFGKSDVEATLLMLATHDEGAVSLGTYARSEAADRVTRADAFSRSREMPLKLTLESQTLRPPPRTWWSRARLAASRGIRHL